MGDAAEWILNHPDHEQDTAKQIKAGAAAIQSGMVVAFPAETVCGSGADVFNPTVALRMPANPIALDLIRRAGTPNAAPSANAFSCTSLTTARHVVEQLGNQRDVVIDGGACQVDVPYRYFVCGRLSGYPAPWLVTQSLCAGDPSLCPFRDSLLFRKVHRCRNSSF